MFASMPPIEAKKLLFRMSAQVLLVCGEGKWERRKLIFIDVKKAHLNGSAGRRICLRETSRFGKFGSSSTGCFV